MNTDFDLVRHILKDVVALSPGKTLDKIEYPQYDRATIYEHIKILEDEGFNDAVTFRAGIPKTVRKFKIMELKWKGNELLKDMGDYAFFKKTKNEFIKTGATLLISSFWEFLKLKANILPVIRTVTLCQSC
jgi:Hypothetical protein (DUF2513)